MEKNDSVLSDVLQDQLIEPCDRQDKEEEEKKHDVMEKMTMLQKKRLMLKVMDNSLK